MKTYEEFLAGHGNVAERARPHYVRWIRMFAGFAAAERQKNGCSEKTARLAGATHDNSSGPNWVNGPAAGPPQAPTVQQTERFLSFLEKRYEAWQVQQARRALQLYSYYQTAIAHPAPRRLVPEGAADWRAAAGVIAKLMRLQHYSLRTERTYLSWVNRFQSYVGTKVPRELTADDLRSFLSHLAVKGRVAAATQKLAFNALLFLYRNVLGVEIEGLATVVRGSVDRAALAKTMKLRAGQKIILAQTVGYPQK